MQYDFSQQTLLEKKQFRFLEDGISIRLSNAGKTHEYALKYENIGAKITYWRNGTNIFLFVAAFFTIVSIAFYFDTSDEKVDPIMQLFILLLIPIFISLYFITFKTACYLTSAGNPNPIEIFSNKPNTTAVDTFINELLSRRRDFLLQRHGQLNKNLGYEPQYHTLTWLLDNDVINRKEYDQKLMELDALYSSNRTIKGFSIENN
jgi:hypothetical protein